MIRENDENGRVLDVSAELKDNAMLKIRPELFDEWDFVKNDELGLDIYKISQGTNKIAWWTCKKCDSEYETPVNKRSSGANCPFCVGRRVNHTNSLAVLRPDLASQWHPTKNERTPQEITIGNDKKVWWLGRCGHEWEATVDNRNKKESGCPYCAGFRVFVGYNDMWTTNPELANKLAYASDGFKYTQGSEQKVDWKCQECDELIKNKRIDNTKNQGLICPKCNDGMSYPEKFIWHVLTQLNIKFELQKTFNWAKNKRYDFYIQPLKCIIEAHGIQHYEISFKNLGAKSLEEEQENDAVKYELAKENDIEYYITIDCRYSKFEHIKNNILGCELKKLFNLDGISWTEINDNMKKSLNPEVLALLEKGLSVKEISKKLGLSLSQAYSIINKYEVKTNNKKHSYALNYEIAICQYDKEMNFIATWKGLRSIEDELGYNKYEIKSCCIGKIKTFKGFIWKYESLKNP